MIDYNYFTISFNPLLNNSFGNLEMLTMEASMYI